MGKTGNLRETKRSVDRLSPLTYEIDVTLLVPHTSMTHSTNISLYSSFLSIEFLTFPLSTLRVESGYI